MFLRQGWIHMISLAIAKSPDFDKARVLTGFLNSVLDGEEGLFQRAFREMGLSEEDVKGLEALPTTYAFASYLTNVAYQGGFREIITAFLCLEWTYLDWAQRLEAAGETSGQRVLPGVDRRSRRGGVGGVGAVDAGSAGRGAAGGRG